MSEAERLSRAAPVGALSPMHECIARFYAAYRSRDVERLDDILDDDIEWFMAGPAEYFDYYGARRGKTAVIEAVTRIMPCYFRISDFDFDHILVDGQRVATSGRIRARQRDTGRLIRIGFAHFLRFESGRLISLRSVSDTFDVAEQVVGHPIDVTREMECVSLAPEDDFSAV